MVHWLRHPASTAGQAWVQSLPKKLDSACHMVCPDSFFKKEKKKGGKGKEGTCIACV